MKLRKYRAISATILSLFLLNQNILAQNSAKIVGYVYDAQTNEPLIAANIWLEEIYLGDASSGDGYFVILNVPPGKHIIHTSYIGYKNVTDSVEVKPGEKVQIILKMDYAAVSLTDAVVVTAQAKGQMSAINEQLSARSIKNVVSSARIQELPDANAAESVGRLPGVSVLRSGGEGSKVVVRGLSPKYNKITIEGVSMSATGQDRSVDISMISPYSLDGIEVTKAATADHDADFIGGAVNFKLRKADPGWRFDLISQGGHNNLRSTNSDYIVTGSASNRFFGDKLGAYFQGNIEQRNRSSNELKADFDVRNNAVIGKNNPVFIRDLILQDVIRERSRYGATVVLDYKLPDGALHFKNFLNNSGTDVKRYNQRFNIATRTHSYEALDQQFDLSTMSNILDFEQRVGRFKFDAKVAHTNSVNEIPGNLSFLFNQRGALASNVQDDPIAPTDVFNFTAINDTNTFLDRATETFNKTKERQFETSIDVQYDFLLSKQINGNIKIGGKYRHKDRSFDTEVFGSDLLIGSSQDANRAILDAFPQFQTGVGNRLIYPFFSNPFNHRDFLEGQYSLGQVADLGLTRQVWDVLQTADLSSFTSFSRFDRSSKTFDYSGTENYRAAYIMSELNLGPYVKFIPGVRFEKNETDYTGVRGVTNISFPEQAYVSNDTTLSRDNDFLLPMVHIKLSPVDWFDARFAYTKTLSRPNFNLIVPRIDIFANTVSWNNFRLEPERSENFDLYLSFHQNHVGLFTVGLFKKEIENMVFSLGRRVITDPADFDLPEGLRFRDIFTQVNNQDKADVKGIELDWQTNFWYLPGAMKGLVLNVNYTHVFSEAKYPFTRVENLAVLPFDPPIFVNVDSFFTRPLINQPDDIANVQLGYDFKGFSARLSMLFQSEIFKSANFWPELSSSAEESWRWDFSVKQNLPRYGVQVFLNFNNITGAKDRDVVSGALWDSSIQQYGSTVDLGLRIKI